MSLASINFLVKAPILASGSKSVSICVYPWLNCFSQVHCGGHRPRRVVGGFGQARALAAVPARLTPAHQRDKDGQN
jgi:hypothetical protein